jgi:NAD(P)-dependent dehydrogenase (short-subunit alcohol dehydrogenase family)
LGPDRRAVAESSIGWQEEGMATVLVTGANRGLGLALCRLLRERRDEVIAVCRRAGPDLKSLGGRVEAGVDVTADQDVADLARRLDGVRLDVVVCNAGILRGSGLEAANLDDVREQLEVNAIGPLRVTRALLPNLGAGSKLALITSRMGSIGDNGSGGYYGYRMSKAALNAAGVSLAVDLRPRGIAVVILHPGYVRTDMTGQHGGVDPDDAARMLLARIDALTLAGTGRFLHANGEQLPW